MNRAKSGKIGLYVVAIIFLSMGLFFLLVILKDPNGNEGKVVKLVISVVVFFGLSIAVLTGAFKIKRQK